MQAFNQPVLSCRGKATLGKDHPDVLTSLNNLAMVLEAQGHLADAEPFYRDALEKSPEPSFKDFLGTCRDFGQWIWSSFRWLISGFGSTAYFLQVSHEKMVQCDFSLVQFWIRKSVCKTRQWQFR